MSFKLEYEVAHAGNKDHAKYCVIELKKARETIKELFKDKEKYKDKIKILSKHIANLKQGASTNSYIKGTLSHKTGVYGLTRIEKDALGFKKQFFKRNFECTNFSDLHEQLISERNSIKARIKALREHRKVITQVERPHKDKRYRMIGTSNQGMNGKGTGFTAIKPGMILTMLKEKKVKTIENAKLPFTKENHVGVEIEFASFLDRNKIGQLFFDAGLINYVQLQHEYVDGRHEREHEHELCIVAPEKEIFSVIEKVCSILNEKVDANITKGCGLHVHIDARNRNIKEMFDKLYNCQEILYDMVAYTRRSNKHVQLMETKQWYPPQGGFRHQPTCKEENCSCVFSSKEDFKAKAFRYYGLNTWSYKSHKTMEIRIHSGTSNAYKINNWIKLLLSIVDGKKVPKYVRNLDEFKKYVTLDSKLSDYVEQRIDNFKQKSPNGD